jgi:hypothetical protein
MQIGETIKFVEVPAPNVTPLFAEPLESPEEITSEPEQTPTPQKVPVGPDSKPFPEESLKPYYFLLRY